MIDKAAGRSQAPQSASSGATVVSAEVCHEDLVFKAASTTTLRYATRRLQEFGRLRRSMVDASLSRFEVSPSQEMSASNSKDETNQQRCKVWEMEKVNKLAFLLGTAAGCLLAVWRDGGGINKER